ncbi:hypothetical protein LWI29_023319 [Acer saccharum]|uniref:Uncharacterized protein n=1 Tax=Acer saccharum TaxID=4024 RepID=A0AA39VR80_ACESA|nr:hypothetical protein LWI29_023319 [Acer saccharum]
MLKDDLSVRKNRTEKRIREADRCQKGVSHPPKGARGSEHRPEKEKKDPIQANRSTVNTLSPLSTIADLYSAIASLIKESDSKTDRDGELLFKQVEKNDVQADATCNVTAMEESVGQAEAASKFDGVASKIDFDKHSSDPRADAPAISKMVEDVDNRTILDENELKEINNCVEFCIQVIVQKIVTDMDVTRNLSIPTSSLSSIPFEEGQFMDMHVYDDVADSGSFAAQFNRWAVKVVFFL